MAKKKTTQAPSSDLLPDDMTLGEATAADVAQPPSPVDEKAAPPLASNADEADVAQSPPTVDKRSYTPNPVITEIPIACPRCKSTKSKVMKTTQFPHRPLQINGKTYPGRIVRRRICLKCSRRFVSNAPYEPEPKPMQPVPCPTCQGRGALPRDDNRKTALICPDCEGSGFTKPEAQTDAEK